MKQVYFFLISWCVAVCAFGQNPTLISPQHNSTVHVQPYMSFLVQSNNAAAARITLRIFINDPRELVCEKTRNASFGEPLIPLWITVEKETGIKPGVQYLAEVSTTSSKGEFLGQQYYTFFTDDVAPAAAATLLKPAAGTTWYVEEDNKYGYLNYAFGNASVQITNPAVRKIRGKVVDKDGNTLSDYPSTPLLDWDKAVTPQQLTNPIGISMSIRMPKELDATLVLAFEDESGQIISTQSYVRHIYKVPFFRLSGRFVTPADGAINVPINTRFVVQIDPDTLSPKLGLDLRPFVSGSISIFDKKTNRSIFYPRGGTGFPGDEFLLEPGTIYEAYTTIYYEKRPISVNVTTTFTTAGNPAKGAFLANPASNSVVSACSGTLQGSVYVTRASMPELTRVSYSLFINDPRTRVWQKEVAIPANQFTGTYPLAYYPISLDMLQPNTQYLLEVTGLDSKGTVLSQEYSTIITAGCGSASRSGSELAAEQLITRSSVAAPVPFAETLSVQIQPAFQKATVHLMGVDGRVLHSRTAKGGNQVSFDTRGLASGLYLIRISDATGKVEKIKVLKQ